MKLHKIGCISLALMSLLHAGLDIGDAQSFSPKVEIKNNLSTIIPKDGELVSDNGNNVTTYLLPKMIEGEINLDNSTIDFCGEHTYVIAVGVNNYQFNKNFSLQNPIKDATKIANKVKGNCKNTTSYLLKDAKKKTIEETLEKISKKATNKDSIVFYYTGTGFKYQNKNYITPTDAKQPFKHIDTYISTKSIFSSLKSTKIKSGLMIFDVCTSEIGH